MERPKPAPCGNCGHPKPNYIRESGIAGRATKSRWYRESITCKRCKLDMGATRPGVALDAWARLYSASSARSAALSHPIPDGCGRWGVHSWAKDGTCLICGTQREDADG